MQSITFPPVLPARDQVADDYFLGLDLAQARDWTALSVIKRSGLPEVFTCLDLVRWQGEPYTAIVREMVQLMNTEAIRGPRYLIVDGTGIGRPVVDMLREAMPEHFRAGCLKAVTITAGGAAHYDELSTYWHVPKVDLVSTYHCLFGTQRFRVAKSLTLADALHREINSFEVKTTAAGAETYSAWREQAHDDLVLSCALALYFGQPRRTPRPWGYDALPAQLTSMKGEEARGPMGAQGHGSEADYFTF